MVDLNYLGLVAASVGPNTDGGKEIESAIAEIERLRTAVQSAFELSRERRWPLVQCILELAVQAEGHNECTDCL